MRTEQDNIAMRENRLKKIWQDDGTVINGWLHIPSTWSAEVMAHAGWDSLTVDLQHGMQGIEMAIQMLQAISTTDTVPIVRVNWNEPGIIMRMLDAGAYGIICPMVDNRDQCEAFVGACRFPPQGYRSLGPTRAVVYSGADYAQHANDEMLTIAMIETTKGLASVEEIASVPGLDAILIGPGDLRLTLTSEGRGDDFDDAVQSILETCQKHNIIPGIFTLSADEARKRIQQGFRFVPVKTDTRLLNEFAKQIIREVREG